MKKEYLGDAVYAQVTRFGELMLTTEDGSPRATNVIVLDDSVLVALEDYLRRARLYVQAERERMASQ